MLDFDYYAGNITDLAYGMSYELEGSETEEEPEGPVYAGSHHGNSNASRRITYGYTISYVPKTGENKGERQTYKYGITSSKKVKSGAYKGKPKRVALQMKKLKRKGLNPTVSIKEFDRRSKASGWESTNIKSGKEKGLKLPGNIRIPR